MTHQRPYRSLVTSPGAVSGGDAGVGARAPARDPHRPLRVLFVGPSPLAPLAAICFEAFSLRSKATASFSSRPGKPRLTTDISAMLRETGQQAGIESWRGMARELDAALIETADLVVTIGHQRRGHEPRLPGAPRRREHWALPQRALEHQPQLRARKLRDGLRARVAMLIFMEGWGRPEMSREAARLTRPPAAEGHHPFIPMRPFRVEAWTPHPR